MVEISTQISIFVGLAGPGTVGLSVPVLRQGSGRVTSEHLLWPSCILLILFKSSC